MLYEIRRLIIEVYQRVTFLDLRQRAKAAFRLTITTVENLTRAVETNTNKVEALREEQSLLRGKFDELLEHNRYLAHAKRRELERAGQTSKF